MSEFATNYKQPVRFSPLPFEAFIYVDENTAGPMFFERRYLDVNKTPLEVLATEIPTDKRGLLRLIANDAHLVNSRAMELALVDADTTMTGVGERVSLYASSVEAAMPGFTTQYQKRIAFANLPYEVSIIIDESTADKEMYFERRYLDADGNELEIRSTQIPPNAIGNRVRLLLDRDMLPCAAKVELALVDEYRAYRGTCDGRPPVDIKIFDFTFDFTFE